MQATSDAMSAAKASWDYGRKPSAPSRPAPAATPNAAERKPARVEISGRGRRRMIDDYVDSTQK